MTWWRWFERVCLTTALVLPAVSAHADTLQTCSDAYSKAQEERLAGHLFSARSQLQICAQDMCPGAAVQDCKEWLSEVEAALPTILVQAKDSAGHVLPAVQVFLDGVSVPTAQLAQPIVLDAGAHNLRFEAAGYQSLQLNPYLRTEDRNVLVSAVLEPNQSAAVPAPTADAAPHTSAQGAVPPATFGLATLGVVALGTSLYFGLSAHNAYEDLKDHCAPNCRQGQADSVHSKALIADVALGASLVAFGAATWIYFSAKPEQAGAAVGVAPTANGASARLRVTF